MWQVVRNLLLFISVFSIALLLFVFTNNNNKATTNTNFIFSDCLLDKKTCVVTLLDNQKIVFSLEPKGLPVMEIMTLSINGFHEAKKKIKIWFEGKDMNMGTHFMLPVSNEIESKDNSYHFRGMIPVCTIDSDMVWFLNAEFMEKSRFYQVRFKLKTDSKE